MYGGYTILKNINILPQLTWKNKAIMTIHYDKRYDITLHLLQEYYQYVIVEL